jgi:adenosine deaminase
VNLASLPKVELHCHLDGVVDGPLLRGLAARGTILPVAPESLDRVIPVRSHAEWDRAYGPLAAACTQPPDSVVSILRAHVERLVSQNVTYAEIMVSGLLDPLGDEGRVVDRFRALQAAATDAGNGAIQVALLVAIGRGRADRAKRQAGRIVALARHGLIVGAAIAGDEQACTIESLAPVIRELRDAGLGIEIHAGETCGAESVWDAIEHGKPDRLGHAVRAFEDERLVDELVRRDTHIEFCPTSNLCLGVVPRIERHPLRRARELGMNFSVNTDDPGPFGCSMLSEYTLLASDLGFTASDFDRIRANAWRSRFTPRGG